MDPLRYHNFAWWLAWDHNGTIPNWEPEDYYQTAMVGLLELWRTTPDAPNQTCLGAMRRAIYAAIREAKRKKRQAEIAPEEEARNVPALDDPERDIVAAQAAQIIFECLDELPDFEFQVTVLAMNGTNMRRFAENQQLSRFKVQQAQRDGRIFLRMWLKALEITA